MSNHTPGPWFWSPRYKTMDGRGTWSLISSVDGYGILSCDGDENSPQEMNDIENAMLIAASPDMLAALQAVVSVADRKTAEFDLARAAIAKATGEYK